MRRPCCSPKPPPVVTDLTVDVQVLMAGAGLGDVDHAARSREMLEVMLEAQCSLVLDTEGLIEAQYSAKTGSGFGTLWVKQMATRGKVTYVPRASIDRGTRTKLNEAGFRISHEDYKLYVRTAASSEGKCIATHDPHFAARAVRKILSRNLQIRVVTADDACRCIA